METDRETLGVVVAESVTASNWQNVAQNSEENRRLLQPRMSLAGRKKKACSDKSVEACTWGLWGRPNRCGWEASLVVVEETLPPS